MKTTLIDHPLFLQIRQEHDQIRLLLKEFEAGGYRDLSLLTKIENFAELEHHAKEEHLLFTHLLNFEVVNSGGPLCMLYFDDYMLNHPIETCKKLVGVEPAPEPHLHEFFNRGSAMRIPINDHLGGKTILRYLIQNFENFTEEKRKSFFTSYQKIQTFHMEKEENCFFYVCANFLTQSSADEMYKKWITKGEFTLKQH